MNDTKKKNKIKIIVITLLTFLVIIAVVAGVCVKCGNGGNTSNNSTESTVDISDYIPEGEYIKINTDNCTLYTDSVIKLTCTSNPAAYSMGVQWSSSDRSVITVTYDGTVTAMAEGMAVITATYGVLSDSVIIHVISEEETPALDLPLYNPDIPDNTIPEPSSENVTQNTSQEGEKETTSHWVKPSTEEQTTTEEHTVWQPPTTPAEIESSTPDMKGIITDSLTDCGFTKYNNLDGIYMFVEDNNNLGQVIVEDGWIQIYVGVRTTTFDRCLKDFLKTVLPTGYIDTFNNFVNAQSVTTFYSDGYMVRVVPPNNGSNSQLIIYY